MDSFLEQQRQQTKLIRLQQQDATENLRKNKYSINVAPTNVDANINNANTIINNANTQKQKEQEATENLRNYRGQPEDFMTQQVKKYSKVGSSGNVNDMMNNKVITQPDVVAPTPKKSIKNNSISISNSNSHSNSISNSNLETVEGQFVPRSAAMEDGNSIVLVSPASERDRDRSGSVSVSQGTTDWSVVSGQDDTNSDRGLSSTPVNVDISQLTEMLSNGPDVAAGVTPSLNSYGEDDTTLSTSYVDASAEMDKVEKRWNVTNVSVSFGLLIHENDAPPEGTFSSPIQNEIVDNLMFKMRIIAEKSLEEKNNVMVAKQDEHPLSIKVQRDANYNAPSNRPGVRRNLIKATIPINAIEGDLQGITNAKAMMYNTLRKSLSDLTSRSS